MMRTRHEHTVQICVATTLEGALRQGISEFGPFHEPITVVAHSSHPPLRLIAEALRADRYRVSERLPDSPVRSVRTLLSKQWRLTPVSAEGTRLSSVRMAEALLPPNQVIAVLDATSHRHGDTSLLELWPKYAHPSLRFGAAIGDDRDGITAEIALSIRPAAVVIAAAFASTPTVMVTRDQVIAELFARSLAQTSYPELREAPGPWEHPLVQRASELGLGVSTPHAIGIRLDASARSDPGVVHHLRGIFSRVGVDFDAAGSSSTA